jgi:uncharacterized protein
VGEFSFEDMKKINRDILGDQVPLELFRAIRLIGMYQGLPMHGKNTTITVGRKIGDSMPVKSIEEVLQLFEHLRIGIPRIIKETKSEIRIAVDDCFCKGLPQLDGQMVCDLEGAILEGSLTKVLNKRLSTREVKCNVHGDEHCEYLITIHD